MWATLVSTEMATWATLALAALNMAVLALVAYIFQHAKGSAAETELKVLRRVREDYVPKAISDLREANTNLLLKSLKEPLYELKADVSEIRKSSSNLDRRLMRIELLLNGGEKEGS